MKRFVKWLIRIFAVMLTIIGLLYVFFLVSPWPSVLIIRHYFDNNGKDMNQALLKYVPDGVQGKLNLHYDETDKNAYLDLYFPTDTLNVSKNKPLIVWIHGGGWVSGNKAFVANYCRILASRGYAVAAVGYSLAPEYKYPKPIFQLNKALAYLNDNAKQYMIDTSRLVLAGDSAGAQIAAQMAALVTNSEYAQKVKIQPVLQPHQLKGVILYCGAFAADEISYKGETGKFFTTVLWSYSGTKQFNNDPYFKTLSVIDYVTSDFPPSFISAGNGDFLLSQSEKFASKLQSLHVETQTLFFPKELKPPLQHEYQFHLDNVSGQKALEESMVFLKHINK